MHSPAKISVIVPVYNCGTTLADEIGWLQESLPEIVGRNFEVVVVDDGSQDDTTEVLNDLQTRYQNLRVARHSRPRGVEAAGQTGLEKSTGDLVFIKEGQDRLALHDLRQLLDLSDDPSVVAARAQSSPDVLAGPLLRRLRAWGAASRTGERSPKGLGRGLQMLRRRHLQALASPAGRQLRLQSGRIVTCTATA